MRLAKFAHDLRGVVGGTVVHHQNFGIPSLFLYVTQQCMERGPNAHAFVIGGNDETVGHGY
jgi:hypothetical protein